VDTFLADKIGDGNWRPLQIGASLELHIHDVDTVKVQQMGDQFHIEVKPQHSGEGKAGASNERDVCTVTQMRPAKRLKTSPLQAQQSSDANMANSTGEREERPRMYKKARVVRSSNVEEKEKEETEEGEDGGDGGGEAAGGGNGKAVGGHLCLILQAWHR
jgi:hypothetical protein